MCILVFLLIFSSFPVGINKIDNIPHIHTMNNEAAPSCLPKEPGPSNQSVGTKQFPYGEYF